MDPVGRPDGSLSITAAALITAWLALVTGSAVAAPPSNDNFANSITVSPIVTHVIGSTAEATLEGGSGEQAPSCQPSYGKSVWFYYAGAAIDVVLDLNTVGSDYDTVIAVWTGLPGSQLNQLTAVSGGCNDDIGGGSLQSRVVLPSGPGINPYWIQVSGWAGASGNLTFNAEWGIPANDDFQDAEVVAPTNSYFVISTEHATLQTAPNEQPPPCRTDYSRSVWYKYNGASIDAALQFTTNSSTFDTVISAWTGSTLGSLSPVTNGCNDDIDFPSNPQSLIQIGVTPGEEPYWIQVSSFGQTEFGTVVFSVSEAPPLHDDFADRQTIASEPFRQVVSTSEATFESGASEPSPSCQPDFGSSVWYSYTPSQNVDIRLHSLICVSGCLPTYDTVIAVYTGSVLSSLTPVACDDDSGLGGDPPPRLADVTFSATAGTTYQIQVGGYQSQGGILDISLDEISTCGNGIIEGLEDCDDSNTNNGDCCNASCRAEASGSVCSDGNACTSGDQCDGLGTCATTPTVCVDGNVCTDDGCDVLLGCTYTPNADPCNDGLFCNGSDTCGGGSCSVHPGDPCPGPDGDNDCSEVCDEGSDNCSLPDPNGSACTDDNLCTILDGCQGGACLGGGPLVCDDLNLCTANSCIPISGCSFTPNTDPCDDGLFCNGSDTCSGGSCSVHPGDPCPGPDGDGDCSEVCNEGPDDCTLPDPNGSSCTDDNLCTVLDDCQSGLCQAGTPLPCDDLNVCTTDTCIPISGCDFAALPNNDGDLLCDAIDNCPYVTNPFQENSDSLPAGDACQCGDLNDNGVIDVQDLEAARKHLVGSTDIGFPYLIERCNVSGPTSSDDCGVDDIYQLERLLRGASATIENVCSAYGAP